MYSLAWKSPTGNCLFSRLRGSELFGPCEALRSSLEVRHHAFPLDSPTNKNIHWSGN